MNLGSGAEPSSSKSTGEHKEALQAISAMLNKHGRGELYFGVKDNGDVIGQDVSDATPPVGVVGVRDRSSPRCSRRSVASTPMMGCDTSNCLLRCRRPYSADGRYFTRVGTSNKALSASG